MTVRYRHVFYLSGFDPRGAGFYYRLFRTESAKQARLGGYEIAVEPRQRPSTFSTSWIARATVDENIVETRYEFLQWDDIIRTHWTRNEVSVLAIYLKSFWTYASTGTLWKVLKASWPPFVTSVLPLMLLLTMFAIAGVATNLAYGLRVADALPIWLKWPAAGGVFALCLQATRFFERRVNNYWLLRIYAFSAKQGNGRLSDLSARLDIFAKYIADQVASSKADEVLIVGHSTGAIMAVDMLGRAMTFYPDVLCNSRRISLLTLGQCIPIVALLPQAHSFRLALKTLAQADNLDWIDFTAPSDAACFALVDPVSVCGITQVDAAQPKPKLLSPRFMTLFSAKRYAALRRDWYRNHFQYIMAGEQAGEYDYFAIATGSMTLEERYRASPSIQHYKRPGPFQ